VVEVGGGGEGGALPAAKNCRVEEWGGRYRRRSQKWCQSRVVSPVREREHIWIRRVVVGSEGDNDAGEVEWW